MPEGGGEEEEDGEEFETAREHDEREEPFACVGDDGECATIAGDTCRETGIGYACECREERVYQRHTHGGEGYASDKDDEYVEAEESYDL